MIQKSKTVDNCTLLQDALNILIEWSDKWLLPFNIDKCRVVHYGKNNTCPQYNMSNREVATEHIMKDLGIIFQNDLKFGHHINCSKIKQQTWINKKYFSTIKCK